MKYLFPEACICRQELGVSDEYVLSVSQSTKTWLFLFGYGDGPKSQTMMKLMIYL